MGRIYLKMGNDDITAGINLVKQTVSGVFKIEEIRSKLKEMSIPLYNEVGTSLIQLGHIEQVGSTTFSGYQWVSREPILKYKIEELMKYTRKKVAAASKRSRDRKKRIEAGTYEQPVAKQPKVTEEVEAEYVEQPVHPHQELVPIDKAIMKAIKLLSENGYKVSKPVIMYEDVTVRLAR